MKARTNENKIAVYVTHYFHRSKTKIHSRLDAEDCFPILGNRHIVH
jgi:ribosomal protein S17E